MLKLMDFGSKVKKGDMVKVLVFCFLYIVFLQFDICGIFLV